MRHSQLAMMTDRIRHYGRRMVQWMFPERCGGCRVLLSSPSQSFCTDCRATVRSLRGSRCPTCALPLRDFTGAERSGLNAPCHDCRETKPPQDGAHAMWLYEGAAAAAIQRAKYSGELWRLRSLGKRLAGWFERLSDLQRPGSLLTAVPMHNAELRERGYNVAIQIAKYATANSAIDTAWNVLEKTEPTRNQAGLTRGERLDNVADVFRVRRSSLVADRHVILVDDVITTGATVAATSRALSGAGAARITVVAAARAPSG